MVTSHIEDRISILEKSAFYNDRTKRIINNYVKTGIIGKKPGRWVYFSYNIINEH